MAFYFAYNTNLDREQMEFRCPSSQAAFRAVLKKYRLDFTFYSIKRGTATADIISDSEEEVWGAVYQVSDEDLLQLDRYEGCPTAYVRFEVTVESETGEEIRCWTYQVANKESGQSPSQGYLELLVDGAKTWLLPIKYLEFLRSIEPEHDSDDHDHDHH